MKRLTAPALAIAASLGAARAVHATPNREIRNEKRTGSKDAFTVQVGLSYP